MSGPGEQNSGLRTVPGTALAPFDDVDMSSSGVFMRLLIVPVMVTLFLAGGVYWLRLQTATTGAERNHEQASMMMVRLIPQPDPAPIPMAVPSDLAARKEAAFAPPSQDQQDEISHATQPAPAAAQPQKRAPSTVESAATAAAPSRTAMQFQQTLLRHIGRYQRYPGAARRNHVQGTVETFFSMRRDGTLLDVWVKTSSGQVLLDQEAIETVRRAQPLPPIPPELPGQLNVQVMLAFDPD